ncbi:MAG: hypothetical protein LBR27_03700 [Bifidobacteriaceae bacterium]|jgi:hypothetical protein|nr:hypothetical protein [Bifidobacteriaceae bacterium]
MTTPEAISLAQAHGIKPEHFRALAGLERFTDPAGQAYYLLPGGIGQAGAQRLVLLAYLDGLGRLDATVPDGAVPDGAVPGGVVAGGVVPGGVVPSGVVAGDVVAGGVVAGDVVPGGVVPDAVADFERITLRQRANRWSYGLALRLVQRHGGALVTTPNGLLMGLGGGRLARWAARQGGTTYGDVFLLHLGRPADAAAVLGGVIGSGRTAHLDGAGRVKTGRLALARLLAHEERHARQWAELGRVRFALSYLWQEATGRHGRRNKWERAAGLADGGYQV